MSSQRVASPELRESDPKVWEWEIPGRDGPTPVSVIQDSLSFVEKHEVVSLFARTIDAALGEGGLDLQKLGSLLDSDLEGVGDRIRSGELDVSEFDIGIIIKAVLRLVEGSPRSVEDLLMIAWSIAPEKREWFRSVALPNMPDDVGFGSIELFIDENWDTLQDFFKRWWAQVTTIQRKARPTRRRRASSATSSG